MAARPNSYLVPSMTTFTPDQVREIGSPEVKRIRAEVEQRLWPSIIHPAQRTTLGR